MTGVLAMLLVLMTSDPPHAGALTVPITVRDNENHQHTIVLGFHPRATYGFDDALGEIPIPPVPAVPAFDIRFLDPYRRKQFPGDGAYVDIRPYVSTAQADTFFVRAQPANNAHPLIFSWPEGLAGFFESIVLAYLLDGSAHKIDMTAQTTFAVTDRAVHSFVIMTSGLKGNLPWKD